MIIDERDPDPSLLLPDSPFCTDGIATDTCDSLLPEAPVRPATDTGAASVMRLPTPDALSMRIFPPSSSSAR